MSDEVTTTVETQPEPSIASAYEEVHGDPTGSKRKPERAESGRNTTLAEEEDTAREIGESGRRRHVVKTQPEVSLADAHDGIATPEAEEFELPDGFSAYSAEDVEAVLGLMGLTEADLKEPRFAALALKELEASFSPIESEDGEESEDDPEEATEEEAEKKAEDKPVEKKTELPIPQTVAEYVGNDPAKAKALEEHIQATYQRASAMSEPVMTDVFVTGLARALQTPAENVPMLKEVVDVLQYGGYALVEASIPKLLPALVDEYMNRNFYPMVEHFIPGLREGHAERTVQSIWGETLEQEEFSGKGLPKFGTPEFHEAAKSVHEKNPWLNDFDPKGPDGKQLPPLQAMRIRAAVTARLLVGERIDSKKQAQLITDAIAKGKKDAEGTNRRVSASRMLGRGKTAGEVGKRENDSRESLIDAWQRGGGGGAI
jgi:hypothetical protein